MSKRSWITALCLSSVACTLIGDAEWERRLDPDGDGLLLEDDCAPNDPAEGPSERVAFYPDTDGDGFGAEPSEEDTGRGDYAAYHCPGTIVSGWAEDGSDCDDNDPDLHPNADEIWYDDIDQNCDGNRYDQDGDGLEHKNHGGDDCDDEDSEVDNESCRFTQIALASEVACGLWGDARFTCWGSRGNPGLDYAPSESGSLLSVGVGANNACVVRADGTIACGGTESSPVLLDTPTDSDFVSVSVNQDNACALTENGSVHCWGIGEPLHPASSGFSQLEVGMYCSCALNDQGLAICWGIPGTCADDIQQTPYLDLGVGYQSACGLTEVGAISCWGVARPSFFETPGGGQYRDLDVGGEGACALTSEGKPVCWGALATDPDFAETAYEWIEVGPNHACARREADGQVDCWGGCEAWPDVCEIPEWSAN